MKYSAVITLLSVLSVAVPAHADENKKFEYSIGLGERYGGAGINIGYPIAEKINVFAGVGLINSHPWLAGLDYYINARDANITYKLTAAYGRTAKAECSTCLEGRFNKSFNSARVGASLLYKSWEYGLYWVDLSEYSDFRNSASEQGVKFSDRSSLKISIGYKF